MSPKNMVREKMSEGIEMETQKLRKIKKLNRRIGQFGFQIQPVKEKNLISRLHIHCHGIQNHSIHIYTAEDKAFEIATKEGEKLGILYKAVNYIFYPYLHPQEIEIFLAALKVESCKWSAVFTSIKCHFSRFGITTL
ncbi:hypothetical protein ACOSP7_009005 [Xanthoceras sorbifolium]